ncbi:MAG: hypothetical protein EOP44_00415 [Sphingobacteriaceae bacterium]|nr:MAG: hypothetical protein EOP44_00415 [Sphingobacteriaceae bacterium]
MGIMSFLRNRMGTILVVVIGLALFAFIIGEVVHYGSSFMNGDRTTIGEVNGEKINYEDYAAKLDQNMQNFKQQSGQQSMNPQMVNYVQQSTWNQQISQIILLKQINKLGIAVGDDESKALIQGNNLPGGFVNPRGLAFDDKGRLYIANDGVGNLIKVIDPIGAATVQIIAGDFGSIKGLAINGTNLYVTMYNSDRVAVCTLKPNGDFGEITGVFELTKPVDIAVKGDLLAISSPESGLITIVEAGKIGGGNTEYAGCKKEISVGTRLFGLAFNPLDNGLFAAHLGENRVLQYKP